MDMAAKFQDQTVFHMTGKRAGDGLRRSTAASGPACWRAYRDLTRLRYDYPVVLLDARRRPRVRAVAVVGRRRSWSPNSHRAASRASACASSCCGSSARSACWSPGARPER